jgi:hypothetical protein
VVPLNLIWGGLFLVALGAVVFGYPLVALPLLVLTAVPLAGLARLAGRATRGLDVNLSDGWQPIRTRRSAVLLAGAGFVVAVVIFTLNLITGFALGNALGWAFATAAGWGLVMTVSVGFTFWPLLTDPERDGGPARAIARLAALLVLAFPFRIGALALLLTALLAVSTVLFAALVSISVAFALMIAARYVLPAADRLEASLVAAGRMDPMRIPSELDED